MKPTPDAKLRNGRLLAWLSLLVVPVAWGLGFSVTIRQQNKDVVLSWPSQTGEVYAVHHRPTLGGSWQTVATNLQAGGSDWNTFTVSNVLGPGGSLGFFRVVSSVTSAPPFTFSWSGTNFTYTDAERTFTGILLKPAGAGPFPAVIINHGAGGTATGYSLQKAREMSVWGLVCIGPTLSHAAGGETNPVSMGYCPENLARETACVNVLGTLSYVDTNRVAIFGHSMGAFASIGDAGVLGSRFRVGTITSGGVIPDSAGTNNAAPTVTEANPVRLPFLMFQCDGDPVVPPMRSQLFQQVLNSNSVPNQRIMYSSNSIPNMNNWHNIHQDPAINADILTNTYQWFHTYGVLP